MASNIIKIVNDRKQKQLDKLSSMKIPFKFDIGMLNMFVGYIFKKSSQINKKSLMNLNTLFMMIDTSIYESNPKALARIEFIKRALDARVTQGLENDDIVINYCRTDGDNKEVESIIENLPEYKKINYEEIKFLNKSVEERLKFSFVLKHKSAFYSAFERLDSGDYTSFKDVNDEIVDVAKRIVTDSRTVSMVTDENTFSLDGDMFDTRITDIVNELKNPSRILKTGVRALNEILAPGFMARRLYIFLGLPAGYKSMILIKAARDIKRYNPHVQCKKPGKKPCVLLITMENNIQETVERLFNMNVCPEDIRGFTPKQVIKMMKEQGGFTLTEDNEVDIIIKYYDNRAIDTMYLYTIIDDLADQNKEVVCLILDYIKRIKPSEYAKDEKEELKNITNELKTLANEYDIPVITAHQLNRAGASAVDAAMLSNKEDLARFIGRGNVGSSWEVVENADWAAIVNVEQKRATKQFYLTFKRIKIRYREMSNLSYFNHPFAGGGKITLIDDVEMDKSISELSLSSDFDGVDLNAVKGSRTATAREVIDEDDDIFDFSKGL